MESIEFWRYAVIVLAYAFGFVCGFVFVIVRQAQMEKKEAKEQLRKVCGHGNSTFTDRHPDFPWECCTCGMLHDGAGRNLG